MRSFHFFVVFALLVAQLIEINATAQQLIGYHSTTLTHVVVPFFESQMTTAADTLGRWWSVFPPCYSSENTMGAPALVLMLTRSVEGDVELDVANEIESENDQALRHQVFERVLMGLSETSRRCFSRTQVCVIRIPKAMDSHSGGARMSLEAMLRGKCIRGERGYGLFAEPDCRPIRSGWLTALRRSLEYPAPPDWAVGSIYRGTFDISDSYLPNRYHINGNAIYRLSGLPYSNEHEMLLLADRMLLDREGYSHFHSDHLRLAELDNRERPLGSTFADLHFHHVRPYVEQKHGDSPVAYDTDLSEFLMHSENYPLVRLVLAHRLRFTPMILNLWNTGWAVQEIVDQNPEAVLVHGGWAELPTEAGAST